MKQKKIRQMFDATEQISERYIEEAMPHSLKNAHRNDGAAETVIANNQKEEHSMKITVTHYIATGVAAAAAFAALIGGGMLIKNLSNKNELRPAASGDSILTEPVQTTTTETTETTTTLTDGSLITTLNTEETLDSRTDISNWAEITSTVQNTPIVGYARNLMGYPGYYYQFSKGQVELLDTDPKNPLISDGVYAYKTVDNALYCNEDGRLIGKIENPDQYIKHSNDMKTVFYYSSVTSVANWWYFVTAELETYPKDDSNYDRLNDSVQLYFWFNAMTGEAKRVVLPERSVPAEYAVSLAEEYIQITPERNAVIAYAQDGKSLHRFAVPGIGEDKTVETELAIGQYTHSLAAPARNGKVICTNGHYDEDTQFYHISLEEFDMINGGSRIIFEDTPIYEIYTYNGIIYCINSNLEGGAEVQEYQPESDSFRTLLKPELEEGSLSSFTAFWDDKVVINGYTGCEETIAIFVSSLEKGTYEFLQ